MVTFKDAVIEERWDTLHSRLKQDVEDFGHWSAANRLPLCVVTCVYRTREENKAIYGYDRNTLHLLEDGVCNAVDVRIRQYSRPQLDDVIRWWELRCKDRSVYELLTHLHGTGPHVHAGVRRP
jgi:hypothetical protein